MNGLMPYTTTATELQRYYKKVANRAKKIGEPLTVLSNNKPDLVVMDYDVFRKQQEKSQKGIGKLIGNKTYDQLCGILTKGEYLEMSSSLDDFEKVDKEEWL